MRRMGGYVRVSKVGGREGPSFISPDIQREKIEALAASSDAVIVDWYTDLDRSGGNNEREQFERILADVEAGALDGVVVARLNRFGRSVIGTHTGLNRIKEAGGTFLCGDPHVDTSNPQSSKLVLGFYALMAEDELDRIRENFDDARAHAARGGRSMAKPLTGYDRPGKTLVPNRDARVIAEMFRRRGRGANLAELARFLDERGVQPWRNPKSTTPAGPRHWSAASVKSLLKNRGYLGEIRHGDVINKEAHPAIVSLAEFEAAQQARGIVVNNNTSEPGLLASLVRCESCRHVLKAKRTGPQRVYRCAGKHTTGTCPAPAAIKASIIEPYVVNLLLGEVGQRRFRPTAVTSEIEAAERAVDEARSELYAFVESASALDAEVFAAGSQSRQQRLHDAEAARRDLFTDEAAALPPATDLARLWPDLNLSEKRRILAAAFDAIVVRAAGGRPGTPVEARVVPLLHGDGPDDLPGRGRRVAFKSFDLPAESRVALA